ncbi:MAG TPA: NIPSNAP family protein [Flavitalea sp.]|nr:NIPSNAP family protein [Flavitalea sp.]
MKNKTLRGSLSIIACLIFFFNASGQQHTRSYYTLRVYYYKSDTQERRIDSFLQYSFIPALHRQGIKKTGVYKPIANDTAALKRIYVLMPFESAIQMMDFAQRLNKDQTYINSSQSFIDAAYNDPPYQRMHTIFLHAFELMPRYATPALTSEKKDRVYELRSYESATESLYRKKVKMFNQGGEIDLFKRLGFNAVFYAEVIAGSQMPNLMYMTSFDNMSAREEHWKSFTNDPAWKKLLLVQEYNNTVSRNETILMRPALYSEL